MRYNLSLHWAVKANILTGSVSGNTAESGNSFPFGSQSAFRRTFTGVGSQVEFNFLPYSDRYEYQHTKRYTPIC